MAKYAPIVPKTGTTSVAVGLRMVVLKGNPGARPSRARAERARLARKRSAIGRAIAGSAGIVQERTSASLITNLAFVDRNPRLAVPHLRL